MTDDIVQRLRKQGRWVVTRRYPLIPQLDEEEWRTDPLCAEAADEIERLRAAIAKVRDLHQPMWVSEEAKAQGKAPWVCCWCGTADGSWPCDTRLLVDEALEGDDR